MFGLILIRILSLIANGQDLKQFITLYLQLKPDLLCIMELLKPSLDSMK